MKRNFFLPGLISLAILAIVSGCGKTENGAQESKEVNIGYFPNLTHIATIVALEKSYFT